jgi:hypothetical protein
LPPVLTLPKVFNEKFWISNSEKLLNNLDCQSTAICVDMTNLQWADPIPLLWLCLTLRNHKKKNTNKIKFKINFTSDEIPHRRFLCFFVQQGFFSEYAKYGDFYYDGEEVLSQEIIINEILDLKEPPIYENASCIAAKIIEVSLLKKKGGLDAFIDSLMDEAIEEVSPKIDSSWSFYKDHAIQKLRHFTSELLENATEHAYHNLQKGAVGIYARVRSGKSYIKNNIWEKQAKSEINNCFLLENWDEYNSNIFSKWIEIFIIDNGIGLLSNLNQWESLEEDAQLLLESIDSKAERPLRTIGHKIFSGGYSKSNRPDSKTRMTGLQLIHETLKRKERQDSAPGEYIRLLTDNEVIAGHLPFETAQARGGIYRTLPKKLPGGTIFHTCIEISDEKIRLPYAFTHAPEAKLAQIRATILENKKPPKLDLFMVDQRYLRTKRVNYDAHRRPTDILNHGETGLSNGDGISRHSTSELNNLFIKKGVVGQTCD